MAEAEQLRESHAGIHRGVREAVHEDQHLGATVWLGRGHRQVLTSAACVVPHQPRVSGIVTHGDIVDLAKACVQRDMRLVVQDTREVGQKATGDGAFYADAAGVVQKAEGVRKAKAEQLRG